MSSVPLLTQSPEARTALERVEIIYTDLDGTLLGRGGSLLTDTEGNPTLVAVEAVVAVNAAKLPVVLTTARNRLQCTEITRLLGWDAFIAELGCVIVTGRAAEPIYFTGEWPAEALGLRQTPYDLIVKTGALERLTEAFPGRIEPHAPYHHNREATVLLRGMIDTDEAREILGRIELPIDIVDNGVIRPRTSGLVGADPIHAYHLVPRGVTKAGAVAADLARRAIAREQAASIGDASSDAEMADVTALGVLVANGLADGHVPAAALSRTNLYATQGERGAGWAEFVRIWLDAREHTH